MSNTLRRIYKQNLVCDQGYPSAPEHQSSLSENTPESPVRSPVHSPVNMYAELDESQEAHSVLTPSLNATTTTAKSQKSASSKSPKLSTPAVNTSGISMSPKIPSQRKIRHRRLGSADSNYHFILPKQNDRRNVRMVNIETQTDALDNISELNVNVCEMATAVSAMSIKSTSETTNSNVKPNDTDDIDGNDDDADADVDYDDADDDDDGVGVPSSPVSDSMPAQNGNRTTHDDTVDQHAPANLSSDDQLIYDYMNSNEQLDIRESSDEDNVEVLNRRVSQFFTQNGLLQTTDNGNGSIIDNRLLLNIMAARRSCISINDKDEVTVMSRGNSRGNSFRTSSTASMFGAHAHDSSRRNSISYKISDHNCNNDDGDDSWTDEEGEESDHNYSLRRRR